MLDWKSWNKMTSKIIEWICPSCGYTCNKEPQNTKFFKCDGIQCPNCTARGMHGNKWIYDDLPTEHPQFWNRKVN